MKVLCILLFYQIFIANANSQGLPNTIIKTLKGEVKEIIEREYSPVKSGEGFEKGEIMFRYNIELDTSGHVLESSFYRYRDDYGQKNYYKSDEEGRTIEHSWFSKDTLIYRAVLNYGTYIDTVYYFGSNDSLMSTSYTIVDKRNQIKHYQNIDSEGNLLYSAHGLLDRNLRTIYEHYHNHFSDDSNIERYKYDSLGNKIEIKYYDGFDNLTSSYLDSYEGQNISRSEQLSFIDNDLEIRSITTYEYDPYFNLTSKKCTSSNKYGNYEYRYVYENDDQSNWIVKLKLKDNILERIVERQIIYY